jgi:hypothetical protein
MCAMIAFMARRPLAISLTNSQWVEEVNTLEVTAARGSRSW